MSGSRRRAGDWNCAQCGFLNFGSRARCKNCSNGARPANHTNKRNKNSGRKKAGDWICNACQTNNFSSRQSCYGCRRSRAANKKSNNSGVSVSVNVNNSKNNNDDNNNNNNNNNNKQFQRNALLKRAGDWKCNNCNLMNFEAAVECKQCSTAKSDSKTLWMRTQFRMDGGAKNAQKNKNKNRKQNKNKSKRPRRQPWLCLFCKTENKAGKRKCNGCKAKRPDKAMQKTIDTIVDAMDAEADAGADSNVAVPAPEQEQEQEEQKEAQPLRFEFSKNSFALISDGGAVQGIELTTNTQTFAVRVSWHVGKSRGRGHALFNSDGSALLAVEILKKIKFGNQLMRVYDPEKVANRVNDVTGEPIYKLKLENVPVDYDDESLTRAIAKANVEDFVDAHVFRDDIGMYSRMDAAMVSMMLNSLFTPFNVQELKVHPSKFGTAMAILTFPSMTACLNAVNTCNGKPDIDFGYGKLKVSLDLRVVLEMPAYVYDVLRPEIEKLMWIIRSDPMRFPQCKVFLFARAKPKPGSSAGSGGGAGGRAKRLSRVVLCGSDSKAICLARDVYSRLCQPLIVRFDDQSKCKLMFRYLQKSFAQFKCCFVHCLLDINTIKIYGKDAIRKELQQAIDGYNKCVVYHTVENVAPLFMRTVMQQPKQKKMLTIFEENEIYVNMNMQKKAIQVVYATSAVHRTPTAANAGAADMDVVVVEAPEPTQAAADAVDIDMKVDTESDANTNHNESANTNGASNAKFIECIACIDSLLASNTTANDGNNTNKSESSTAVLCGVCFTDIEENDEAVTLKNCEHSFHFDCFQMQLGSVSVPGGTRPVQCATCNANIALSDLEECMQSNEQYQNLLLLSAFDYIERRPTEFKNCPTADCKQIYVVAPQETPVDEGNDNDSDMKVDGGHDGEGNVHDGNNNNNNNNNSNVSTSTGASKTKTKSMDESIFNCTECMRQYCLNCKDAEGDNQAIAYHFGMSCESYQSSLDSDNSFKEFMNSYLSNSITKRCPSCNTITDKFKNTCNHATCVYCGTHFCWKCLWVSTTNPKSGSLVYTHLKKAHGGYYGN